MLSVSNTNIQKTKLFNHNFVTKEKTPQSTFESGHARSHNFLFFVLVCVSPFVTKKKNKKQTCEKQQFLQQKQTNQKQKQQAQKHSHKKKTIEIIPPSQSAQEGSIVQSDPSSPNASHSATDARLSLSSQYHNPVLSSCVRV